MFKAREAEAERAAGGRYVVSVGASMYDTILTLKPTDTDASLGLSNMQIVKAKSYPAQVHCASGVSRILAF